MRKDVRFGLAIAAILLVVLVVYVFIGPAEEKPPVAIDTSAAAVPEITVTNVEPEVLEVAPPPPPPTPVVTVTPDPFAPTSAANDAQPRAGDINWEQMLNDGTMPLMGRQEQPAAAPIAEAPAAGFESSTYYGAPAAPAPAPLATSGARTYVVQSGDSLYTIAAREYGNPNYWPHIARANPSINPNRLKLGATLLLPSVEQVNPTVVTTPTTPDTTPAINTLFAQTPVATLNTTPAPLGPNDYKVQAGDSLHRIAARTLGSAQRWQEIYDLNKATIGPDPARLKVGMTLRLPAAPAVAAQ